MRPALFYFFLNIKVFFFCSGSITQASGVIIGEGILSSILRRVGVA